MLKQYDFPVINPVDADAHRPFWSVMIPCYNGGQYLEETLKSILAQAPSPTEMQIEVVDDCSTELGLAELVQTVGQGRVSFYRNPQNLGLFGNWNYCIQRSRGHWVHLLHQDDIILPGFYTQMQKAAELEQIGAAFCRHIYMDEDGHWLFISNLEHKESGILPNWQERFTLANGIQCPSVIVKRDVYEQLGGFYPLLPYSADVEMWGRIAARYPIYYEPLPLACWRIHGGSATSSLIRSGQYITDMYTVMEIFATYFAPEIIIPSFKQIKSRTIRAGISHIRESLTAYDWQAVIAQVKALLKCDRSFRSILSLASLPVWLGLEQIRTLKTKITKNI